MKNIWKLLMIAMMAIAMVGCPQGGNNSDDDDTPGAIQPYYDKVEPAISETGIYTYTLNETMIGSGFDSTNTFDTLKFILVPKTVADGIVAENITDGAGLATKENKVLAYANNTYGNGRIFKNSVGSDGYYAIWSALKDAEGYEAAGVKKNGKGYDIIFDMNKAAAAVEKLLAFVVVGTDQPEVTEEDQGKIAQTGYKPSDIAGILVENYVPCIIGSVCQNGYDDEKNPFGIEYACNLWNSGVVPMAAAADGVEFPETLKSVTKEIPDIDFTQLTHHVGNHTDWGFVALSGSINAETGLYFDYTYALNSNDWHSGYLKFAFCNGTWDYALRNGIVISALDTDVTADGEKIGGEPNIDAAASLFNLYAKYRISLKKYSDGKMADIKITKIEDAPTFAAPTIKFFDSTADNASPLTASNTPTAWGSYTFTAPAEEPTKDGYAFAGYAAEKTNDRSKAITSIWIEPGKTEYKLYPVFVKVFTVTITDPEAAEGTLTVKNGDNVVADGAKVDKGTSLAIQAIAKDGYVCTGITANGLKFDNDDTTGDANVDVTTDVTIAAAFAQLHAITIATVAETDGTVTITGAEGSAEKGFKAIVGKKITIAATPAEGKEVDTISVTKTSDSSTVTVDNKNTFTMPDEAVTIDVTFKAKA